MDLGLDSLSLNELAADLTTKADVLFLFSGQGSQYSGMGKALYDENEAFRNAMDRCDDIYMSLTGESLIDMIFGSDNDELLTNNAQPALVALEWSLAQLWQSKGLSPSIVLGHSLGEIAAACVAGAMSIDTALELVVARSKLVHSLPSNNGTMAAVRCSMEDANAAMSTALSEDEQGLVGVASVNGPNCIVLSGMRDIVDKVLLALGKKGIHLQMSHAFHSPLMKGMEEAFRNFIGGLDIHRPLTIPIASTVASRIVQAGETISVEHWVKQLASPVLFKQAFTAAMNCGDHEASDRIIVEAGPSPVLSKMARSWWRPNLNDGDASDPLWAASLDKVRPSAMDEALEAVELALAAKNPAQVIFPNRTRLPWPESPPHPLLQHAVPIGSRGTEYHTIFHAKLMGLYRDHVIPGMNLFPAAGYVEMGLAAGAKMSPQGMKGGVELLDVKFSRPMELEIGSSMVAERYSGGGMEFYRKDSESPGDESLMLAEINQINPFDGGTALPTQMTLDNWKRSHPRKVNDVRGRYDRLAEAGYHLGAFQSIESVWLNEGKNGLLASLRLPESWTHEHDAYYHAHPAVLDGVFQLVGFVAEVFSADASWVPAGISRVAMHRSGEFHQRQNLWARLTLETDSQTTKLCNIEVLDEEKSIVMTVEGLRFARIGSSKPRLPKAMLHTTSWTEIESNDTNDTNPQGAPFVILQLENAFAGSTLVDELDATVMTVSDIEAASIDEVPEDVVVPILKADIEPSNSQVLEECLQLIQFVSSNPKHSHRVCFVTCNAEGPKVEGGNDFTADAAAVNAAVLGGGVWGLARTAVLELGGISLVCVDTDAKPNDASVAGQIRRECLNPAETEISYRGDRRFVRRLSKGAKISGDVELVVNQGGIEKLSISPVSPDKFATAIPDDSVEVSVYATGLNFKDVLNVIMPDETALHVFGPPRPGFEFAGIVTGTPAASKFQVGDHVFGIGADFFRSRVRVLTSSVAKTPPGLTFEEASTMPIVFLTVYMALREQAQLKSGDRVLIHSAAGGDGLAAIQYAQHVGAEIFATASPSKHEYLRSLGVNNISTSRDGGVFASEMKELVGDQGVDVVLSAGFLIEESVPLLATGGNFVDIAKQNIWSEDQMKEARPDVKYFTYTLGDAMRDFPEQNSSRLESLASATETGAVRPLPTEVFDFQGGIIDAFQRLRSGNTIGKVAVKIQNERNVGVAVITGGLGGLGLLTAEQILELGAEHVVLVSRSGTVPDYAGQNLQARLTKLLQIQDGTAVSIEQCDISNEAAVQTLLDGVRSRRGKINTVIHSSGVLRDKPFNEMDPEALQACFGPKAAGSWYLHKHTLNDDLSHFVVFSSVIGLFGNPRQLNHSASSTQLDALIRIRHGASRCNHFQPSNYCRSDQSSMPAIGTTGRCE